MSQPLDPFAASFDAIEPDRSANSRAAFDEAFTHAAQRVTQRKTDPGFYMLDDARGRFVVDRDMGVISLASDALLDAERGAVHEVRLRVVEPSGASYELAMKLRVNGRIPSMVGAEDIDFFAGLPPELVAPSAELIAPQTLQIGWTSFSVACGQTGKATLRIDGAAFASAMEPLPTPEAPGPFRLHLFTPLPAVSALGATWSL